MKLSSGFKVGVLTLAAILILVFTVLWVKGRSISAGERITVAFKDVNGLRAGSGVQMMGVRIGQVESLEPKINSENSYIELKFVITEPNVKIPEASSISIQQTGIIGEQFLEVTPPQMQTIYVPLTGKKVLHVGDKVQTVLSKELHDIGVIKSAELVETKDLPKIISKDIPSKIAIKVGYIVNLPGLELPELLRGEIRSKNDVETLRIKPVKDIALKLPQTDSPYTIIEPMRVSDFLKLQYRSANALAETNEKLSAILSDDVMKDIQQVIKNADELTANATVAVDKASVLIDVSKDEISSLSVQVNDLTAKLNKIADSVMDVTSEKDFAKNVNETMDNINKLSGNVNKIVEDPETEKLLADLKITMKNVSELSDCLNKMSKDPRVKEEVAKTFKNLNEALCKLTVTLDTVNYATEDQRDELKQSIKDVEATTANVKKFSEKLNKRFLLFRLMF